jgi:phage gp36-like protein
MAYCTRADLEAAIGFDALARIADADMDGSEDSASVDAVIADIDALISSKIARPWPDYVGVSTVVLRPIAVDLVVDRLARGPASTDDIQRRAKQARADLEAIAAGTAQPDVGIPAAGTAGMVEFSAGRKVFPGGIY